MRSAEWMLGMSEVLGARPSAAVEFRDPYTEDQPICPSKSVVSTDWVQTMFDSCDKHTAVTLTYESNEEAACMVPRQSGLRRFGWG
jgi:hypothetical protein